jgi:uncharacterized SAM-binding protein YcdF (DUF218 family)
MFFILSKTIGYLARPLVVIVLLFISSLVIRSKVWKRRLFIAAFASLLFCSNEFISNEVMRLWELPPTPFAEIKKEYEVGILLTGVTKSNFSPNDRVYFQRSSDRVTHTLQLYKSGHIKKILISGGSGTIQERTKEADELSVVLQMMGVPEGDLIIENQSDNTYQSAVAVKKMIGALYQPTDCLLITSGYHMRRSRACFKKAGYDVDTFSVDFLSNKRSFTPDILLLPKVESVFLWQVLMKEWVGMLAYKLAGYI